MDTTRIMIGIPVIGRYLLHMKAALLEQMRDDPVARLGVKLPAKLQPQARRLFTLLVDPSEIADESHDGMMRMAERLALMHYGAQIQAGTHAVELGSFTGVGTCFLAAGVASAAGEHVWAVDTFEGTTTIDFEQDRYRRSLTALGGSTYDTFQAHLYRCGLEHRATARPGYTTARAEDWNEGPIGLLLVDADHTYASCRADFLAWQPHLANGAIVLFHDYEPGFPGVIRAVDELLESHPLALIDTVCSLKVCRYRVAASQAQDASPAVLGRIHTREEDVQTPWHKAA